MTQRTHNFLLSKEYPKIARTKCCINNIKPDGTYVKYNVKLPLRFFTYIPMFYMWEMKDGEKVKKKSVGENLWLSLQLPPCGKKKVEQKEEKKEL